MTTAPAGPSGQLSKPKILDAFDNPISDEETLLIYRWLDTLEFSRPKTATNRDFSDAVMMAELVAHYIPKLCNATFYLPTSATPKKIENWEHLNRKVFRRIGFQLTPDLIQKLATSRPGVIERVLMSLRPTLLRGHRAVIPLSHKLDSVKSRFMEYQKTPSSTLDKPKSTFVSKHKTHVPTKARRASRGGVGLVAEIFKRPPAKSPSPSVLEEESKLTIEKSVKVSWLSEDSNANKELAEMSGSLLEDEQPIDIISSSPEQTEDEAPHDYEATSAYSEEDEVSKNENKRRKSQRFRKQVIKYEFKEELLLNGSSNCLLPTKQQLHTVAKNFMTPGNGGRNCRGYGLV